MPHQSKAVQPVKGWLSRLFVYDPATNSLIEAHLPPPRRWEHTATALASTTVLAMISARMVSEPVVRIYASATLAAVALLGFLLIALDRYKHFVPSIVWPSARLDRFRHALAAAERRKNVPDAILRRAFDVLIPFLAAACVYSLLEMFLSFKFGADRLQTTLKAAESMSVTLQTGPWSYALKPKKEHLLLVFTVLSIFSLIAPSVPVPAIWRFWKRVSRQIGRITVVTTFIASVTFFSQEHGDAIALRAARLSRLRDEIRASYSDTKKSVQKAALRAEAKEIVLKARPQLESLVAQAAMHAAQIAAYQKTIDLLRRYSTNTPGPPPEADFLKSVRDDFTGNAAPRAESPVSGRSAAEAPPDDWSKARAQAIQKEAAEAAGFGDEIPSRFKPAVEMFVDTAYSKSVEPALEALKASVGLDDVLMGYCAGLLVDTPLAEWLKGRALQIAEQAVRGAAQAQTAIGQLAAETKLRLIGHLSELDRHASRLVSQFERVNLETRQKVQAVEDEMNDAKSVLAESQARPASKAGTDSSDLLRQKIERPADSYFEGRGRQTPGDTEPKSSFGHCICSEFVDGVLVASFPIPPGAPCGAQICH